MKSANQQPIHNDCRLGTSAPDWAKVWWSQFGVLCLILGGTAMISPAQDSQTSSNSTKFTTLFNFDLTNGASPHAALAQGTDGNLYGTASAGGDNLADCADGCGTVFKMTSGGTLTKLYSFCSQADCGDGAAPFAALIQATDGNFYGTTVGGGAGNGGTVFRITPSGALKTLYSFCSQTNCADGSSPTAGLVQAGDGNFYGTTDEGGANGEGTIFRITPVAGLTTIYSFCSQPNCADGSVPYAGLVWAADGDLYGTTHDGGADRRGTVFKWSLPSGRLTTLHSFCAESACADGADPYAALVQSNSGNFYGTTFAGGANGEGSVFKITPSGALATVYSFCSESDCADGRQPMAGLIQAIDGNLYGTTGSNTVFKLAPGGTLTTLYSFLCSPDGCRNGIAPNGLVEGTNGTFYGTTQVGGLSVSSPLCYPLLPDTGCGTAFSLALGLGAFVDTLPTFGRVGETIRILGTNLTGATSVTFNGTLALFKVVSASLISSTVPAGATSGFVTVTIPTGTLKSAMRFQVRP